MHSPKKGSQSPSFLFQRNSKQGDARSRQLSIELGGMKLMKSIEKASPRELQQLLNDTIQSQQDRKWNASDLKIQGNNMGYPD